jgi:hypothetical protein
VEEVAGLRVRAMSRMHVLLALGLKCSLIIERAVFYFHPSPPRLFSLATVKR